MRRLQLISSIGSAVIGAAGAVIAALALVDLFVTVFNYDGFPESSVADCHLTNLSARAHCLLSNR